MSLRAAALQWLIALVILLMLIGLNANFGIPGIITFIYYISAGIYLNRQVLRRLVEWNHPVHGTIDNESSAKLGFLLLWPIRYIVLFAKLGIIKAL